MVKYKVHTTYINVNGVLVCAGIYNETDIDLAEARKKSIITSHDIEDSVNTIKSTENINIDSIDKIGLQIITDNSSDTYKKTEDNIKLIELEPSTTVTTVEKLKINLIEEKEFIEKKIKYVGKATVAKVIKERSTQEFSSYLDLDTRVPLSLGKTWENTVAVDFTKKVITSSNTIVYT